MKRLIISLLALACAAAPTAAMAQTPIQEKENSVLTPAQLHAKDYAKDDRKIITELALCVAGGFFAGATPYLIAQATVKIGKLLGVMLPGSYVRPMLGFAGIIAAFYAGYFGSKLKYEDLDLDKGHGDLALPVTLTWVAIMSAVSLFQPISSLE